MVRAWTTATSSVRARGPRRHARLDRRHAGRRRSGGARSPVRRPRARRLRGDRVAVAGGGRRRHPRRPAVALRPRRRSQSLRGLRDAAAVRAGREDHVVRRHGRAPDRPRAARPPARAELPALAGAGHQHPSGRGGAGAALRRRLLPLAASTAGARRRDDLGGRRLHARERRHGRRSREPSLGRAHADRRGGDRRASRS